MVPFGHSFIYSFTRYQAQVPKGSGYSEREMDIVLCLWSEHDGGGDKSDDRCNEKGNSLVRTVIGGS